ncbi:MAG: DUF4179 domain-containing protein [Clostridia bacterium]|nr:DUF4179 domain-containing protein [Clostridia bacterium]
MFRDDYRELFDSVSPPIALEQRTEREINEMLHPARKQKNYIRRAAIAAMAVLLIVGAAFAAVHASGILDRLFKYSEPSETAQQSVIRDSMQVSENGITFNMDEYLFDRNTLHLGWTVSSERESDVFYISSYNYSYTSPADEILEEESIGSTYGAYGSSETGDGILIHLNPENPSHSGYAGFGYKRMPEGTINTSVTIRAFETDFAFEDVESAFDLAFANPGDPASLALESAGKIGIDANHMASVNGYNAYNEALQKLLDQGMEWDAAHDAAYTEFGIFREVAVLELNVSIDPARAAEPRFALDEDRRIELPGTTVILKTLSIDTASTIIEYDVITDKTDINGANGLGLAYIFLDQDGNLLEPAYIQGAYGNEFEAPAGKQAWHISHDGNPLPESVTSITFVPRGQLERRENEPTNDYLLRVKEAADPAQCFTIDLK